MQCDEAKKRWHKRLETGAADPSLDKHLEGCASCHLFDREMSSVLNQLHSLRQATENIGTNVTHHHPTRISKRRSSWLSTARLAAVIAIVVTAGWYVAHDDGTTTWSEHGPPRAPMAPPMAVNGDARSHEHDEHLGVSLLGDSAKRYMAVALKTNDPRVRLYKLYRTLEEETPNRPSS